MVEGNDDGFFGMMDIPEHSLARLVVCSCGYDVGDIRTGHFQAVPKRFHDLVVHADAGDVFEGDAELALESPDFVCAFDVEMENVIDDFGFDHGDVISLIIPYY